MTQALKYIYIYIYIAIYHAFVKSATSIGAPRKAPLIKTKRICIQNPPRHRLLTAAHSDSIIIYYLSLSSGYTNTL